MKISKLFHSLYALLMLAPVFAVGGAMAFNIINDKAVDNAQNEDITYHNVNYLYQTNEVLVNADDDEFYDTSTLIVGNIYQMVFNGSADDGSDILDYEYTCISVLGFYVYEQSSSDIISGSFLYPSPFNASYLAVSISDTDFINITLGYIFDDAVTSSSFYFSTHDGYPYSISMIFVILDDIQPSNYDWMYTIQSCPQEYIPFTTQEVTITYPDNLSDNFYYALDSMNNSEVFSWAKTSFLAEPFSYIFGLFGIPSGSPFITLLSYWLSISIIWLVFDLVMYVPLLVHGWIDKGGIE